MPWPRIRKLSAWVIALLVGTASIIWLYDVYRRPLMVTKILNISSPPESLQVMECESPLTTDVLTTCSIEISPSEFPLLLAGYTFIESSTNGTSHALGLPKVGPEFAVSTEFMAEPPKFEYGGFVRVIADKERKRAIVDLYIE